jgi:hypothetical protein
LIPEVRHWIGKVGTQRIERQNLNFRTHLKRLQRSKALNAKGTTAMNYTQLMTNVGKTVSKIASEDMNHNQNPQLDARFGDPKIVIFTIPAAAAVKPPPGGKKKGI